VDRLDKALKKLSAAQRKALLELIAEIEAGRINDLDILKLKGFKSLYRVRKGDLRLIVRRTSEDYRVMALEWRSGRTYSNLESLDTEK
jgi:mRNA-degrading endonuclease RelE of RelBE toxin-antitoxin system